LGQQHAGRAPHRHHRSPPTSGRNSLRRDERSVSGFVANNRLSRVFSATRIHRHHAFCKGVCTTLIRNGTPLPSAAAPPEVPGRCHPLEQQSGGCDFERHANDDWCRIASSCVLKSSDDTGAECIACLYDRQSQGR
jgi:hypothetical protein